MNTPGERVRNLDWPRIHAQLDEHGFAVTDCLLPEKTCRQLIAGFGHDGLYRKTVVMARHNYGKGSYRYFDYPLPDPVPELRSALYTRLSPLANEWYQRLGKEPAFPERLPDYTAQCHAVGQMLPTPLILAYEAGDFNCLHQDLYGDLYFPPAGGRSPQ